jgi:phosphate:Na+ symporter
VTAVKSVKHLRKNILRHTTQDEGAVTELYDRLRTGIARITAEIRKLQLSAPEDRSTLWLDQESAQIEDDAQMTTQQVDLLIREGALTATAATSFINDSGYAYSAMRDLIEAVRRVLSEPDSAMAEIEELLTLDEDEIADAVTDPRQSHLNETVTGHKKTSQETATTPKMPARPET